MRETPSLLEFDPRHIPWQYDSIKEIFRKYDFSLGIHEVMASGSVGSAKSLWGTHIACIHILNNPGAICMIGRQKMPDLRATVAQTIADHLEGDFVDGEDYEFNKTRIEWIFANGSKIISRSWHDKKFGKFRSLKLSMALIEELTENDLEHWDFYDAVYQRIGRIPTIKQNIMVSMTNPDSPSHPAYKKLILGSENDPLKHVYYSLTTDNPFLPAWYRENLIKNLSPIEIQRMIHGKWVEDPKGGIYYNYNRERNYRPDCYIYNLNYPIDIMFDFNIGVGKPMSLAVGQVSGDIFHIAKEVHVEGANTSEILDELASTGIFERKTSFRVFGDASGKARDTRSKTNDYEIIERFIREYRRKDGSRPSYQMCVPRSNPPIRKRHNKVNAKFCNFEQRTQLYIYKDAEWVDEGFRLTKLKKGGQYLEDDSIPQQHVTTAVGYWIVYVLEYLRRPMSTIRVR